MTTMDRRGQPSAAADEARADAFLIWSMVDAGVQRGAIVVAYGCTKEVIRDVIDSRRSRERGPDGLTRVGRLRMRPTEDFREAYDRLGTVKAVGRELGCHPDTVRKRLDLYRDRPRGEMSIAEMKRRYAAGESLSTISAAAGVVSSTVRGRLMAAGVEIRPAGGAHRYEAADTLRSHAHAVCLLYEAGANTTLLAPIFGCHSSTVRLLLIQNGVPRRMNHRPAGAKRQRLTRLAIAVRDGAVIVEDGRLVPVKRRVAA